MAFQRPARNVLEEWRELERRLELQPEADKLRSQADRVREEYRQRVDEAISHRRPAPQPFPEVDPPRHETGGGPDLAFRR